MKKILIFSIIFALLISSLLFSVSAEILNPQPNYFLTIDGSNIAYPVYDVVEQSNYLNIGLRQVYGADKTNFIFTNYTGTQFKITIFDNNDYIQVYYVEHNGLYWDEPLEVYNGLGDDVVIAVQEYPVIGLVTSYSIDGSVYVETLNDLTPSLGMLNIQNIENLPEGYTLYELPNAPPETTPGESTPENDMPTLPPYTMPDNPLDESLNAFENLIVGIGAGTTDGYKVLFFNDGALTTIGYIFLIILGLVFACYILKIIFNIVRRKQND